MEAMMFVKPQKGLTVLDPVSLVPLSEDGEWKPFVGVEGNYWRRRIADGTICFAQKDLPKKQEEIKPEEKKKYYGGKS